LFIGEIVMCQPNNEGKAINPSTSAIIPGFELEELSLKAMRGDGEAAKRISQHYSIGFNNSSMGLYWALIGAENDYSDSQWSVSYQLTYSNSLDTRGIFWCIQAARKGKEYAIDNLRRLGIPPEIQYFEEIEYTNINGNLSDAEMEAMKKNALKGSGRAALALSNYYSTMNDNELMEYWYRIGAQNGDPECQYRYGKILKKKEGIYDLERGDFWTNKVVENGW
jgi:TPR repeat protein